MVCIQIELIIRTIRKNHEKDTTVNPSEIGTSEIRIKSII